MVDNSSTDGSIECVKNNFLWVRLIQSNKNLGYAGGNNIGAEVANGDYIVILNNDTEVDGRWLNELLSIVKSDLR